jgi:VWFA-related protein
MRTTSLRALLVAALAVMAAAVPALTQGPSAARERTLFVSAVDARGEPVEGLALQDFIVTEDGRRREVLRVSRATEPLDVALLVDNSTAAEGAVVPLRDGVRAFITAMAGTHQVALVTLASRPTIVVDYTSDPKRLLDGAGRIFADSASGTTLFDGIVEVSAGLARREAARAAIVAVITDGVEFTNRYHRDVINAATRAGASLHVVTVGTFSATTEIEREREFLLELGPRATGGQRIALLSNTAIEQALGRLARQLSSQYKVVYGRPESFLPPEEIEVEAARPGLTMRAAAARGQGGA